MNAVKDHIWHPATTFPCKRLCAVTTSWDDGHPDDLRVAELLCKYGMKGTFYVPKQSKFAVMDKDGIRQLQAMGMEVGGHTLTHADLSVLDENAIARELIDGKAWLEDLLGSPVTSIAYPYGRYNRRVCRLAEEAGYVIGRTADHLDTSLSFDPFRMPVTFQCYPHGPSVHFKHALKAGRFCPLIDWLFRAGGPSSLVEMGEAYWRRVQSRGRGLWHLWGHSWELEQAGVWKEFETILQQVARQSGASYLSNTEVAATALRESAARGSCA